MLYSQDIINEVRLQSNIVSVIEKYVSLKPKGSLYFGLCPFHNEKSPSFSVNPQEQLYFCHGCSAGGNVFNFLMEMEGYSFLESLQHLADENNINLPKPSQQENYQEENNLKIRLFEIHKTTALFYHNLLLSDEGKVAREYLLSRGLEQKYWKRFGLGFSGVTKNSLLEHLNSKNYNINDMLESGLINKSKTSISYYDRFKNRLMFPIINYQNKVVGFGGRILSSGEPKYLNSPKTPIYDKSKNLYNLNLAKKTRIKKLIIVEGYMDAIAIYNGGFPGVVATLGTACNQDHANALKRYASEVILLFDSDNAGTQAALRAIPILVENGLTVKVLQVTNGKDPDEFLKEHGSSEFSKLLNDAVHYITFQINCSRNNYDLTIIEEKIKFVTEVAKILSKLTNKIERSVYVKEVSKSTQVEEDAILEEIGKYITVNEKEYERKALQNTNLGSRVSVPRVLGNEKGLLLAQKDILFFSALNPNVYKTIINHLSVEDFTTDIYKDVFKALSILYSKNTYIYSHDVVGYFSGHSQQNIVTAIFALPPTLDNDELMEKSINASFQAIKRFSVESQINLLLKDDTKSNELKQVVEFKKQLPKIYITI